MSLSPRCCFEHIFGEPFASIVYCPMIHSLAVSLSPQEIISFSKQYLLFDEPFALNLFLVIA